MSKCDNHRFSDFSESDKILLEELQLAKIAASNSHDPSRQVGAVIVDRAGKVLVRAANTVPYGVHVEKSRVENRSNGEKYHWIEHAERNAIYLAAKRGIQLNNCRMIATLFPCADCARAIIQSGISHLVIPELEGPVLRFERSSVVARQMLQEAGVLVTELPTNPSSTPK